MSSASLGDKNLYYAKRLAEMIKCKTISNKEKMYLYFNEYMRSLGIKVDEGIFGADMKVRLLNDGPVTIILDSSEW